MTGDAVGRLRYRVLLQRPVRNAAEGGGATIGWEVIGSAYAAIEAISGTEVDLADGVAERMNLRVTLRYRTDIEAGSRIIASGRVLNIESALDRDGQKRWLHCLCRELLP